MSNFNRGPCNIRPHTAGFPDDTLCSTVARFGRQIVVYRDFFGKHR